HALWHIDPTVTSMTVNVLIEASDSASGPWTPADTYFGTTTVHGKNTLSSNGGFAPDRSHVDIAFYTSTCGDGTVDGNFSREACDPAVAGSPCCTAGCAFSSTATVCRSSAGICDPAENCTGASAACPGDTLSGTSTVCRASAGICDPAELCTGTSGPCPSDTLSSSSTVCRASAGSCDPAELCTGTSGPCPSDTLSSSSTVCRASAGICDPAESCTGTSV